MSGSGFTPCGSNGTRGRCWMKSCSRTPPTSQQGNNSCSLSNVIRFLISAGFKSEILPNRSFCFLLGQEILLRYLIGQALQHSPEELK